MKNIIENIRLYVDAWNETTPKAVKAKFSECCAPDMTYTDKTTPLFTGIYKLVDLVTGSYQKTPGRTFSLLTQPEYFDGQVYYTWAFRYRV
ncbi:hypothetical protein [Mucilaginibacter oryzae]|nr:hypothetical protein [Mucilaginibacter oryzae]